ncbi:transmembrane anchored protein (plasmid) [Sinorhizobium sp. B11]
MFKLIAAAFLMLISASSFTYAGNCNHSWDRASDGSSCGGRASDQRDGGSSGW